MKRMRLYLLGLISLCALALSAQDLERAVYFASGSHALDAEARQALEAFLQAARQQSAGHLQVRAYTDDIGGEGYNLDLAQRRALAVKDYLAAQGLRVNQETVEPLGKLAPEAGLDLAESRRRNRRVDLRLMVFRPEDREAFFEFFRREALQTRRFDPTQDIVFEGQKGGRVRIPAFSLCDAQGQPVRGLVEVDLIEAYTFEDMILQNLQTASGSGFLQTGGMVYVEARDLNGQKLQLHPERPMTVAMPGGDKPMPQGMQVFLASREPNAQANDLSWDLQGNDFQEIRYSRRRMPLHNDGILEPSFLTPNLDSLLEITYQQLPPLRQKPQMPTLPRLTKFSLPDTSLAMLRQSDSRKKGESQRRYERRIAERHSYLKDNYQKYERLNTEGQARYTAQMANYAQALARYREDSSSYERYLDEVRAVVATWASTEELAVATWSLSNRLSSNIYAINNLAQPDGRYIRAKETLLANARAASLDQWLSELEALSVDLSLNAAATRNLQQAKALIHKGQSQVQRHRAIAQQILVNLGYETGVGVARHLPAWVTNRRRCDSLALANQALNLKAIYEMGGLLNLLPQAARNVQTEYQSLAQNIPALVQEPIARKRQVFECLRQWDNRIYEEYKKRGLLSDAEVKEQFFYEAQVPGLGWINCDRFQDIPGERIELMVEKAAEPSESWFIVFPRIKGLLNMGVSPQGFKAQGVPPTETARLVGMRVNAKQEVEICILEGKAKDLQTVRQPKFKTASLEEFRLELAKVNG